MALQRYSDKELRVFLWVIGPYTIIVNFLGLGNCVVESLRAFLVYGVLSMIYFFSGYFVFGLVGAYIQRKMPASQELFKRIGIMLPVFYLMNLGLMMGYYVYYENIVKFTCSPLRSQFVWVFAFGCFASTVITFINEGAANWEKWKSAITETEQLKNAYQKSKLYGLKGQIYPHFLFNCFNSLSSLISESEKEAEYFLNQMAKVHRYMLRTDDEQLVTLEDEMKFAHAYLYLIEVRFGSAIRVYFDVEKSVLQYNLPPLSLQVILENVIYTNAASKSEPLHLSIISQGTQLIIRHSVQAKLIVDDGSLLEGLDNLITKYRLIGMGEVSVDESVKERSIILPLFTQISEMA